MLFTSHRSPLNISATSYYKQTTLFLFLMLLALLGFPYAGLAQAITNGSFETPAVGGSSYQYNPTSGSWTFSGNSGVQSNGSAWAVSNAPDGTQTAFLQSNPSQGAGVTGSISQTVSFSTPGTYVLSFQAARRSSQVQPVRFSVDGTQVGALLTPTGNSFGLLTTAPFTISAAGAHTVMLAATDNSSDLSTMVDQVSIAASATSATSATSADFTATASPSQFGIAPTGSASTALTLTSSGGFSGPVALSISGLPSGASAVFTPASPVSVTAGAAVLDTLKITTGSVAAGTYSLMLTAISGTLSHSIPLILIVAPPVMSAVRLTDLYLTATGALTHRIEWSQGVPTVNYSGPGTVSNVTITGYTISRTGASAGTAANTLFWIDSPPLGSQQLQFNTQYIYTVTANYSYTVTGDPKQTSGGGTVTVGSCQVTSVKTAVADDQAVDSRLDPRYSTNMFLDHKFGSTFYRGGLFAGYNNDPARVGRSLLKFTLPSLPSGQRLWRAGSVCAYATRGFAAGTTTVYCQRVNDNWTGPTVVWSLAPTLPGSSSGVAVTYDGTNPINAWENWTLFPDIYAALNGNGGTLSVTLASTNESSGNWAYFAKKEYDVTLSPYVLYSYGAPN